CDDDLITENVDLSNNQLSGYKDDGLESKGANVNVRFWGNRISADQADSCMASNSNDATQVEGQLYIFRNTCRVTASNPNGETVYKNFSGAPTYLFHNSVDAYPAPNPWDGYGIGKLTTALNNILQTRGPQIDSGSGVFDYNLYNPDGSHDF